VVMALANAGTAFIKWGQWASCRTDMFPERLCAELSRLHSQAPTHGYEHTKAEVEQAVGCPIEAWFESFDKRPFASGSIAQLHLAKRNGELVAVKVRHPRVVERIVSDFTLMKGAADAIARRKSLAWLNLKASVDQFSATMVAQTRLDVEAEHIRRMAWNFDQAGWRDVRFPKALLATPSVLIESFEPGELVSRYTIQRSLKIRTDEQGLSPRLARFLITRGEESYLRMLLVDNFMHADMHPGNILLQVDGRKPVGPDGGGGKPTLIWLDLGMVAQLDKAESAAFIGFLQSLGTGDGRAAARHVLRFTEEQPCETPELFAEDMAAFFAKSCRGYGTDVNFGEVLRGVLNIVRKHRVTIDANYMTLVTNCLCLDGMALELLPSVNVLDLARPLLATSRWVPRAVFKRTLPLLLAIKRLGDSAAARLQDSAVSS